MEAMVGAKALSKTKPGTSEEDQQEDHCSWGRVNGGGSAGEGMVGEELWELQEARLHSKDSGIFCK